MPAQRCIEDVSVHAAIVHSAPQPGVTLVYNGPVLLTGSQNQAENLSQSVEATPEAITCGEFF